MPPVDEMWTTLRDLPDSIAVALLWGSGRSGGPVQRAKLGVRHTELDGTMPRVKLELQGPPAQRHPQGDHVVCRESKAPERQLHFQH